MLKKNLLGLIVGTLVAGSAMAGGEEVNCRDEKTGERPIYQGKASCLVYVSGKWHTLSETFGPTRVKDHLITKTIDNKERSCLASVPFSHMEDIIERVCDYYPTAILEVNNYSYGEVSVKLTASDRDGSVVKKELYVDGQLQSSNTVQLHGYIGQSFHIRAVVVDDEGYSVGKSQYATIEDTGVLQPF